MSRGPIRYYDDIRWLGARNTGAAAIVPYGLCAIVGADPDGTLQVAQPTADSQDCVVACLSGLAAGGGGMVTREDPVLIQYNASDGTPAQGQLWGAGANSSLLRSNNGQTGWIIDGAPSGGLVMAHRPQVLLSGGGNADINFFRQIGTSPVNVSYTGGNITGLTGYTLQPNPNQLGGTCFVNPRTLTIDEIAVWVDTGVSGVKVRVGVYAAISATNLMPGALVYGTGDLDTTGLTGAYISVIPGSPFTLQAGVLYWIFANCQDGGSSGQPTLGGNYEIFMFNVLGVNNNAWQQYYGIIHPYTYGAMPNPFPTLAQSDLTDGGSAGGGWVLPVLHIASAA